jgi:hypothetical protein
MEEANLTSGTRSPKNLSLKEVALKKAYLNFPSTKELDEIEAWKSFGMIKERIVPIEHCISK